MNTFINEVSGRTELPSFSRRFTSRELKIKQKWENIAGLQLADLLHHSVRRRILIEKSGLEAPNDNFSYRLADTAETLFNRHLYNGTIWGYGKVLFPE